MKKRLSTDPIDVELDFIVGDRVKVQFISSTYHNMNVNATIIGIHIEHTLQWKRLLDHKGEIVETSKVIYTVVSDDGELYVQSKWHFRLYPLEED